jgi:hypothetical protein
LTTTFENKTSILAELWLNYRAEEEFQDFCEYNDIGLPLAYAIANGIVQTTPLATTFIEETFALLVEALGQEDLGFDSLDDLLGIEEQ